jgi:hypothetical protein
VPFRGTLARFSVSILEEGGRRSQVFTLELFPGWRHFRVGDDPTGTRKIDDTKLGERIGLLPSTEYRVQCDRRRWSTLSLSTRYAQWSLSDGPL